MLSSMLKFRPGTIDELPIVSRHNTSKPKHQRLEIRPISTAPRPRTSECGEISNDPPLDRANGIAPWTVAESVGGPKPRISSLLQLKPCAAFMRRFSFTLHSIGTSNLPNTQLELTSHN
jgi:hypothetical protein